MKIFIFALSCIALTASATPLHWYSALDHFNFASDERPMDAGFRFELGVFSDGFVPTAENRDEWSAYWVPAQRVGYHGGNRWYSGYLVVEDNEAPFVAGAEAWVWGFSGDASGGDWILFRNSSWKWPRANPRIPVARHWNAKNANTVLIGLVEQESTRLLTAEAVENSIPPATTFEQWAAETGNSTDPSNIILFATGSKQPPLRMNRFLGDGGAPGMEIRLAHLADRRLQRIGLEVSEDLVNWEPFDAYGHLKDSSPTEIIFEVEQEALAENQLFFRAEYE